MREIKFRAWDKDKKQFTNSIDGVSLNGQILNLAASEHGIANLPANVELMQYTSLKDKNGTEIYEGDIVRILYTDWASPPKGDKRTLEQYQIQDLCKIGDVVYKNAKYSINFHLPYSPWNNGHGSIFPGKHGWVEVIGNIYQDGHILDNVVK